jgi:hypothetical protein
VPRFPRVVSPIATLFTRDGIDVLLVSIEVWPEHLVVRLAASGDHAEELGSDLLAPVEVAVEDDAGNTHSPRSSNMGGSGSEWHGDWFFAAAVPDSVRGLTVRVDAPYGEATTVDVELAD